MNVSLRLFAIELIVILGLGTAAWLLSLWRGRRRRTAELEALLDTLETAAPERCERYCQWLKTHCGVDEEQALLTANTWLEAERRFWRHFITWRLEPDPAGLARLPAHLHRYLDDRLEALGPLLRPSEPGAETAETGEAEGTPDPVDRPGAPPQSEPAVTDGTGPETPREPDGTEENAVPAATAEETAATDSGPEPESAGENDDPEPSAPEDGTEAAGDAPGDDNDEDDVVILSDSGPETGPQSPAPPQ